MFAEKIMEKFFQYRLNTSPHFKPGEGHYYSDINYVLLGLIIEQITGEILPQHIRKRILEPLNRNDTYFEYYEPIHGNQKRIDASLQYHKIN
ncbi:MAG: serine hydrolase [Candidatus Aminicenantes bacterium]|nr:serine hydrolase [Candidatus Aminicenantes bacterium]